MTQLRPLAVQSQTSIPITLWREITLWHTETGHSPVVTHALDILKDHLGSEIIPGRSCMLPEPRDGIFPVYNTVIAPLAPFTLRARVKVIMSYRK